MIRFDDEMVKSDPGLWFDHMLCMNELTLDQAVRKTKNMGIGDHYCRKAAALILPDVISHTYFIYNDGNQFLTKFQVETLNV